MGHRLSKIYTRTGDDGSTGLGDGSRVEKDSARIEAIGKVDELNSHLGVLRAEDLPETIDFALHDVQHDLFDLGGELSIPGHEAMTAQHIMCLEMLLDQSNASLAPLKEFILPGGSRPAALCHVARTVCREAERRVVSLARQEKVGTPARVYLNRLSDLLFVYARVLNTAAGKPDILWQPRRVAGQSIPANK